MYRSDPVNAEISGNCAMDKGTEPGGQQWETNYPTDGLDTTYIFRGLCVGWLGVGGSWTAASHSHYLEFALTFCPRLSVSEYNKTT